ncbi:MAG: sugar phosphate isomerase/epimerase, partial [Nitrososphaerales archaeon]
IEGFKECTEYAEDREIFLGLEHLTNLEGNIVCTLDDLISMIRDISSKNFGAVIDTGHVNITKESLTDYVKLLKNKIFHIHWDNNDGLIDSTVKFIENPQLSKIVSLSLFEKFLKVSLLSN